MFHLRSSEKRVQTAQKSSGANNCSMSLIHQQSSARPNDQTPYLMTFNDGQTFQQMFDLGSRGENSRMLNSTQTFKKKDVCSQNSQKAHDQSASGEHLIEENRNSSSPIPLTNTTETHLEEEMAIDQLNGNDPKNGRPKPNERVILDQNDDQEKL